MDTVNPSEGTEPVDDSIDAVAGLLLQKRQAAQQESEQDNPEVVNEEVEDDQSSFESEDELDETFEDEESESEESEEDEDYSADDVEEPITVKIEGKEVTLDELQSGYMKDADYRKKTAELAELRREAEAERESIKELQSVQENVLKEREILTEVLSSTVLTNDQLKQIRESKGIEAYVDAKEANDLRQKQIQSLRDKNKADRDGMLENQTKELEKVAEQERQQLLSKVPDLKNPEIAQGLANYLITDAGVTEQELGNIVDHRLYELAFKAMKYDQIQKKAKPKQKVPKVKGGKNNRKDKSQVQTELTRKLEGKARRSGNINDIAALIKQRSR